MSELSSPPITLSVLGQSDMCRLARVAMPCVICMSQTVGGLSEFFEFSSVGLVWVGWVGIGWCMGRRQNESEGCVQLIT
jgi:hypothetical protein